MFSDPKVTFKAGLQRKLIGTNFTYFVLAVVCYIEANH